VASSASVFAYNTAAMSRKPVSKPKLTDAERHARFVEMAHKVGASEDPKDFDKAFKKVVSTAKNHPPSKGKL
jgi:hypothetical protein